MSSVRRTSAYVRNPRRVSSGSVAGGSSSHASISAAIHGPTPRSSVSGRPEPATSPASSGQNREALDARSSALRRWSVCSRAARRSNSPRSPFVGDVADAFRVGPYPDGGGFGGGDVAAGTGEDAAGAVVGIVTTRELEGGMAAGSHIDS